MFIFFIIPCVLVAAHITVATILNAVERNIIDEYIKA